MIFSAYEIYVGDSDSLATFSKFVLHLVHFTFINRYMSELNVFSYCLKEFPWPGKVMKKINIYCKIHIFLVMFCYEIFNWLEMVFL